MLYPDAEKRAIEICRIAELFKGKGYSKTADKILEFTEILKEEKAPSGFLSKLDDLFNIFQMEFEKPPQVGQDFRKRCYEEVKSLVFSAIGRMHSDFAQATLELYPSLARALEDKLRVKLLMSYRGSNSKMIISFFTFSASHF